MLTLKRAATTTILDLEQENMLASIIKRDGTEVAFDSVKILNAITKANKASGEDMSPTDLLFVTEKVCRKLEAQNLRHVEEIQDVVEETLIQYDYAKTAKAYILYRDQRSKARESTPSAATRNRT